MLSTVCSLTNCVNFFFLSVTQTISPTPWLFISVADPERYSGENPDLPFPNRLFQTTCLMLNSCIDRIACYYSTGWFVFLMESHFPTILNLRHIPMKCFGRYPLIVTLLCSQSSFVRPALNTWSSLLSEKSQQWDNSAFQHEPVKPIEIQNETVV